MVPNAHVFPVAKVTRPADTTAYASGDLVANSTTAGSVTPLTFTSCTLAPGVPAQIVRVRINKSGTSVTNAAFRLHLFAASSVTVANGDNGAFSTNQAASYLGQIDVTVGQAFTDGASGSATTAINFASSTTSIIGLLECRGAYTPASAEVFTVILEVAQD